MRNKKNRVENGSLKGRFQGAFTRQKHKKARLEDEDGGWMGKSLTPPIMESMVHSYPLTNVMVVLQLYSFFYMSQSL